MDESRLSFTSTTCSKGHLRVLVIIPAYNEQECILNTVAAIKAAGYDYVVINDGSQDTTLELVESMVSTYWICRRTLVSVERSKRAINMPRDLAMISTFRLTAMANMILLIFLSL